MFSGGYRNGTLAKIGLKKRLKKSEVQQETSREVIYETPEQLGIL